MRKPLLKILVSVVVCVGLFGAINLSHAQVPSTGLPIGTTRTAAETAGASGITGALARAAGSVFDFTGWVLSPLGQALMKLTSYITMMGAVILNASIYYTVVNMADGLKTIQINTAWALLRDLANMGFIFMLLYISIKTIIGVEKDTRQLVVRMIIAAILVNFSLFFTKVFIDMANLLAMTFYGAIAPLSSLTSDSFLNAGLSNGIVRVLGAQTLWRPVSIENGSSFIVAAILISITLLIIAFVFFAMAMLFIIRYVVLIFTLILSPLMFLSMVFPGLASYRKKWWDALSGQALFAPVFFLLMWVVLTLIAGVSESILGASGAGGAEKSLAAAFSSTDYSAGVVPVVINFAVIIAFLIAAVFITMQVANKAGGNITNISKWALGAGFGFAGWTGRQSVGRLGTLAAKNDRLVNAADKKTGMAGAASRLALYASKKAASGTFDLRNASVPTGMVSDAIRGTVGRTEIGRKIGADRFDGIESIEVGSRVSPLVGAGAGGTKGQREINEEKKRKWEKIEAEQSQEARLARRRLDIESGLNASSGSIEEVAMEKAIASMTDKEIEVMVDGNRKLLENQKFANMLSVQQLEALNKSDKFSEQEKDKLKSVRFSAINTAMATGGGGASTIGPAIKGLSDTELEMIDPAYLSNSDFVSQLRPAQIESINKSKKFTKSQKDSLRNARRSELLAAISSRDATKAQKIMRALNPKEIATLPIATLTNHVVLPSYTPKTLNRMAEEMTPVDIQQLRDEILKAASPLRGLPTIAGTPEEQLVKTADWLLTPDGNNFS